MTRAIRLGTDNTVTEVEVELAYPGLTEALDANMVQTVHAQRLLDPFPRGDRVVMVVDEEFALKELPFNEFATRLYTPRIYRGQQGIQGDVLLVGLTRLPSGDSDYVALPGIVTVEAITNLIERFEDH